MGIETKLFNTFNKTVTGTVAKRISKSEVLARRDLPKGDSFQSNLITNFTKEAKPGLINIDTLSEKIKNSIKTKFSSNPISLLEWFVKR